MHKKPTKYLNNKLVIVVTLTIDIVNNTCKISTTDVQFRSAC